MHIYLYLYIRVRMRICVCVFECEWECVCVCVFVYVLCARVCVCVCSCTHTHVKTHRYAFHRTLLCICLYMHTDYSFTYITRAHNTSQTRVQMAYQWLHQYILSTQLAVQIPLERWSLSVCVQWIMPTSTCQHGNKSLSHCQTFVSFILTGLASPGSRQPKLCWQTNTWLRTGSPGTISDSWYLVVRVSWCKKSVARRNVDAKRMQTVHSQDRATKMHVR